MSTPCLPGFFDQGARSVAPASLIQWERICLTLSEREIEMFQRVAAYLRETGRPDVTGGELAAHFELPVTHVRPRITGLLKKHWLESGAMRPSRAKDEGPCHPVWLAVPGEAIARAQVALRKKDVA